MRATQFFISTQKEAPSDAEVVSHQLMVRAGMIKRLGSGIYTYMPIGLKVIRKVEAIVREEMNPNANNNNFVSIPNPANTSSNNPQIIDITESQSEPESLSLEDKEIELIRKSLKKHNGKRKKAAQELGISERTLYRKIKQYDLE